MARVIAQLNEQNEQLQRFKTTRNQRWKTYTAAAKNWIF